MFAAMIMMLRRLCFFIMPTTSPDDKDPQLGCTGSHFVTVVPHLLRNDGTVLTDED